MIDGFINVYKEKGYTSHDVVAIIRKLTGMKTGHTGTLDPDAEGVLPICIGKATKLSEKITASDKQYLCELKLGVSTDTQDASGTVISEKEVNAGADEIKAAVMSFIGEYYQTPPMYSAVKVNGKKLYELAREGKEIERKQRLVHIHNIEIKNITLPCSVEMLVDCSKGTYIRTLCSDIGAKLCCGGHMAVLVRTKAGGFDIKDSIGINEIRNAAADNRLDEIIVPIEGIL